MSTLMTSYTTATSRPPVLPASSRSSWRPSVAFKPSYLALKCRRPLTVTCALPEKGRPTSAFSIPPTALLCPVAPPDGNERWDIEDDNDRVTLRLQVPGVSANDIEVATTEDVLEIKRKVAAGSGDRGKEATDVHGVGEFHVRLLMAGMDNSGNVKAHLKNGMLVVIVQKKQLEKKIVPLGEQIREKKGASSGVPGEKKP